MFVRWVCWIRWAIKRICNSHAELIGDSGWSMTRRDDGNTGHIEGVVPEPDFSSKPER